MDYDCDVLVVGAGPAGVAAARSAALGGANTILIEKKDEIGNFIQCGEGFSNYLMGKLPFKIPKKFISREIRGLRFSLDDFFVELSGDYWGGLSINKKGFLEHITKEAKEAGTKVLTGHELVSIKDGNTSHPVAVIRHYKDEFSLKPKVIIGADGVNSSVFENIFPQNKKTVAYVVCREYVGISLDAPEFDYMYFNEETPYDYPFLFPIDNKRALIGVVSVSSRENALRSFDIFLQSNKIKNLILSASAFVDRSGGVTLTQNKKIMENNILLVGDSANHNIKPFFEGNLPGIIAGNIAGEVASEFILGSGELTEYITRLNESLGEELEYSKEMANLMLKINMLQDSKKAALLNFGLFSNLIGSKELKNSLKLEIEEVRDVLNQKLINLN